MAKKAATKTETTATTKDEGLRQVVIARPNLQRIALKIRGSSPYVQNKFSSKAAQQMKETQEAGSVAKKNKKKQPKDFKQNYLDAMHVSDAGWHGIPASAFRAAMVSACRVCGFKMTVAKLSVFIIADGYDSEGTGMVKITKGKPQYREDAVTLQGTTRDIRARPMWLPGWEATVCVQFDADQFSAEDVTNLFNRVGSQVGIGEGRPDSKTSVGMGWGLFDIVND